MVAVAVVVVVVCHMSESRYLLEEYVGAGANIGHGNRGPGKHKNSLLFDQ